ncbi:uncharacterized mitochondrial protein AtMg00810-like [Nicotiana sylvestris]|uniref:uncharacterized mitochondrial protein AtMg00810-like n=1 Tax=Nicotiana sylvestris TaxID=4096 RepID=UPI00388C9C74
MSHDIVIILVYVDDLLITGSNISLVEEAKHTLHNNFKVKDLGELRYFLGIEVMRSDQGILLNQRKYALELISSTGLAAAKPASTPIELNQKLTTTEYDKHVGHNGDEELQDVGSYQRLVGQLLYLTITRPDICFAVQVLSQFMQHPKQSHLIAALRVVRYIKGSPGLGIFLKKGPITHLSAFCDSDWAACPNTQRSITGYAVKLGDSLLSWKSKKQQTVSRSLAEAEYRSLAAVTAEPVDVYCDSKAALQIAANPIFDERTKYIEIDCHFVREKIKSGLLAPHHISTKLQLADLLTKGLGVAQHSFLLSKLGVFDAFHPPA